MRFVVLHVIALAPVRLCYARPGVVIAWGNSLGQPRVMPGEEYMTACAGGYHRPAITADGTLVAWGDNSRGQRSVPSGAHLLASFCGDGVILCCAVGRDALTIVASDVCRRVHFL